jgi:2-polyprenyl-3-methyl-5-hydroxy-6-metoxy-1,4-benzoquinol methylase
LQNAEAYKAENIFDFDNQINLNYYPHRILEKLTDYKKNLAELSVLDLGLGRGYTALVFENKFNDYTILDGDRKIIEMYREKNPNSNINIIETYFETYNTDKKFDVIVLGYILEHVDDPVAIMKKYAGYLEKDGIIFAAVPNAETLNRRLGKEMGLLSDLTELSPNDIQVGHKRYYTVETFKNDILSAGLNMVTLEGIYLKPFTTRQLISFNLSKDIYNALCVVGRDYPELSLGMLAELKI